MFDPEAGTGVGDDEHSYAFDGHRQRKWHGVSPQNVGVFFFVACVFLSFFTRNFFYYFFFSFWGGVVW